MTSESNDLSSDNGLESVYNSISTVLRTAHDAALRSVNTVMVQAYWNVGRIIVEEEQQGQTRAAYGTALIPFLAKRLTVEFGKGFTENNLWYMRQFYQKFPILHAVRGELSWTHYRLLLKVENEKARDFYMQEAVRSNWSTRQLDRQISALFYERLMMSRDREGASRLASDSEGQVVKTALDLIKDPYVLEFLGVRENEIVQERDLEQGLMNRLQEFLLELGKGFAFVARQRRITVDGDHYYVDLVFYNYLLKCFVLLDLKVGKLTHQDIGQMDFYVRYFEQEERLAGDNPPIGIILCSDKTEAMVKYTLLADSEQIFASRYKLYLPSDEELMRELRLKRDQIELEQQI